MLRRFIKKGKENPEEEVQPDLRPGAEHPSQELSGDSEENEESEKQEEEVQPDLRPDAEQPPRELSGNSQNSEESQNSRDSQDEKVDKVEKECCLSPEVLELVEQDEKEGDSREILDILNQIVNSTPASPVSSEIYRLLQRGLRYQADIEKALSEGELRGRNTRIDKLIQETPDRGDGVPRLGGIPNGWNASGYDSIFDLALSAR